MKYRSHIFIVALLTFSYGYLYSAGTGPDNRNPSSVPDQSGIDIARPEIPDSILAILEGRVEVLHLEPVRIVAGKQMVPRASAWNARLSKTETAPDLVPPEGSLRSEMLKYGTDLFALARLCAVRRQLPTITIDTFDGEDYEVELQSYESSGLNSGVFTGRIKDDSGSLVSLLFRGRDFQKIMIFPSNSNTVVIKSDSNGWHRVSEASGSLISAVCGNE